RHQQRTINADGIHRGHHVVAGNVLGTAQGAHPRTTGMIALIRMNLGINRQHHALQPIALRSSVENASLSHAPWNVGGVPSSVRDARIAGLWQCPSAKYVTA